MTRLLPILTFLLSCTFAALAQEETIKRREAIPYIPPLESLIGDPLETSKDSGKSNNTSSLISSLGGSYNPSVPPEVARANAIGNIQVNLYRGSNYQFAHLYYYRRTLEYSP